jgi:hypothetical protein
MDSLFALRRESLLLRALSAKLYFFVLLAAAFFFFDGSFGRVLPKEPW